MKIKIFSVLACGLLILAACKKYEDGPSISFRSKSNRVVGDWDVSSAYLYDPTGITKYDSLSTVYQDSLKVQYYQFGSDNKFTLRNQNNEVKLGGVRWNFDSRDENIVLDNINGKIMPLKIKKLEYENLKVEYKISTVKVLAINYIRK